MWKHSRVRCFATASVYRERFLDRRRRPTRRGGPERSRRCVRRDRGVGARDSQGAGAEVLGIEVDVRWHHAVCEARDSLSSDDAGGPRMVSHLGGRRAGSPLRRSVAPRHADRHRRRHPIPGARHRREHGDLFRSQQPSRACASSRTAGSTGGAPLEPLRRPRIPLDESPMGADSRSPSRPVPDDVRVLAENDAV
jgi:hypothetical protein